MDDGAADDLREVDPFSSLRLKKRSLLEGRDKLISQIQALPHYNSFMVPLSFDALRSAALSGFILTNHFNGPPIFLSFFTTHLPPSLQAPMIPTAVQALKDALLDLRN